ncbi:hypothetical protein D3C78_1713260 [compost metagenome]
MLLPLIIYTSINKNRSTITYNNVLRPKLLPDTKYAIELLWNTRSDRNEMKHTRELLKLVHSRFCHIGDMPSFIKLYRHHLFQLDFPF